MVSGSSGPPEPGLDTRSTEAAAVRPGPPSATGGWNRLLLVDTHLGTLATLSVLLPPGPGILSTSRLTEAFRWALQSPPDLLVLGCDRLLPDAVSLVRHVRRPPLAIDVLVTSTECAPWRVPPLSHLVDGVFERPGQLLDLIERIHTLLTLPPALHRSGADGATRRVIEFVALNYRPVPHVRDVADRVGVSATHLSSIFRRAVGMTLKDYLRRVRVEVTKHLLVEMDTSLDEVAELVGFCDAGHLCRVFARDVGTTPGRFRRAAR